METEKPVDKLDVVITDADMQLTPKPKPPKEPKVYVTNPGFRDSLPLRKLQAELHREENRRRKKA